MSQTINGMTPATTPPGAGDTPLLAGEPAGDKPAVPLLSGEGEGGGQDGNKGQPDDKNGNGGQPDAGDGKKDVPQGEGLFPLPDDASDEQRADFEKKIRTLNRVPENAEGYEDFGFGEDVKIDRNSEDYKFYTQLFHDTGLSKAQAKKLLEGHYKYAGEQVQHHQRREAEIIQEYRTKVKQDFIKSCGGEEQFKEFNATAVRGFKAAAQGAGLTGKDVDGLIAVMGDDPRFIRIFHGIGKLFREDVLITGAAPRTQEKTFDDMFKGMFKQHQE